MSKRTSELKKLYGLFMMHFASLLEEREPRISLSSLAPFCGQRTPFQLQAKVQARPGEFKNARTVKYLSYEETFVTFTEALDLVRSFDTPTADDLMAGSIAVMMEVTTPAQRTQMLRDAGLDSIADAVESAHEKKKRT